jgi:hypothetical protein
MTITDVLTVCYHRGVRLLVTDGKLSARGPAISINDALREGLNAHKQDLIAMLGEGLHPDPDLPDRVLYPAHLPNTDQAFRAHYKAQRVTAA